MDSWIYRCNGRWVSMRSVSAATMMQFPGAIHWEPPLRPKFPTAHANAILPALVSDWTRAKILTPSLLPQTENSALRTKTHLKRTQLHLTAMPGTGPAIVPREARGWSQGRWWKGIWCATGTLQIAAWQPSLWSQPEASTSGVAAKNSAPQPHFNNNHLKTSATGV